MIFESFYVIAWVFKCSECLFVHILSRRYGHLIRVYGCLLLLLLYRWSLLFFGDTVWISGYRRQLRRRDARYWELADDNIPSEKYRDTGIPRYFMTSSIVDNFRKNPRVQIICNCLTDSFCHVLMILCVNFLPLNQGDQKVEEVNRDRVFWSGRSKKRRDRWWDT